MENVDYILPFYLMVYIQDHRFWSHHLVMGLNLDFRFPIFRDSGFLLWSHPKSWWCNPRPWYNSCFSALFDDVSIWNAPLPPLTAPPWNPSLSLLATVWYCHKNHISLHQQSLHHITQISLYPLATTKPTSPLINNPLHLLMHVMKERNVSGLYPTLLHFCMCWQFIKED